MAKLTHKMGKTTCEKKGNDSSKAYEKYIQPPEEKLDFETFTNYMKELDLLNLEGQETLIFNDNGKKIGEMINSHYAEGIVKTHFCYIECIKILNEIYEITTDKTIKNKIEHMLLTSTHL